MAADDRDDTFHDAFGEGRRDEADRWPANEAGPAGDVDRPKTGKSGVVKVLLILLAVAVVAGVLCCGGAFWWVSTWKPTEDPVKVRAQTAEIIDIEIPESYQPAMAMNMNMVFMTMQMTMWTAPGNGMLMIAQAQAPQGADQAQMEQQLSQSMRQQQMGQQLNVKESETRTISIEGKDVDFTFAKATNANDNSDWRQVTGAFPGKGGTAFINLQQPADSFDEAAVVKMLESIKTK